MFETETVTSIETETDRGGERDGNRSQARESEGICTDRRPMRFT